MAGIQKPEVIWHATVIECWSVKRQAVRALFDLLFFRYIEWSALSKPCQNDQNAAESRMSRFTQLPIMDWPRGLAKAVATFDAKPSDFESGCGIKFERTLDQLDDCDVALVQLMSGACFALVSYPHHPVKGVQLWIFENSPSPRKDLIDAMQALQGMKWQPLWIHGDIGDFLVS